LQSFDSFAFLSLNVVGLALDHIERIGSRVQETLRDEQMPSILDPSGPYGGDDNARNYLSIFHNYIPPDEIRKLLRGMPACSFSVRKSKQTDPMTGFYLAKFVIVNTSHGTTEYLWSFCSSQGRFFRHHNNGHRRVEEGHSTLCDLLCDIAIFYFHAHDMHSNEVRDWLNAEAKSALRKIIAVEEIIAGG
jgi:hypothetical protein